MSTQAKQLVLRGSLTSADMHQTRPIFIDVPEGVTNMHFTFRHRPSFAPDQKLPHQISVMIFDTHGPRFEISKPDDDGVDINAARTSPGGINGPIPAGQWMIFILVFRLLSEEPVDYVLTVDMSFDPIEAQAVAWPVPVTGGRGPGWYRGDLHAHTIHSDGRWDVPDIVAFWKAKGVDFMTLSDHNTISGLAQVRSLADGQLLTMGGIELSTFFGHAVAVGARDWLDWRRMDGSTMTMPELAQSVIDAGALFVIAHLMHPGDPLCCGCRWEHYDMMPGNAQAVEIWNGAWEAFNQESLQLFYHWLDEGHRLTATSGTDLHGPPPAGARGAVNVVYAEDLTEEAIVAAIKAGRSYISAGPELLLSAHTASGVEGMIGDTLPPEECTLTVRWRAAHTGDYLRLVVNGRAYHEKIVGEAGEVQWALAAGQARWCTVELRDADNGMWAVTNPIYFAAAN
ncbi:MAG: CehA/McbA family metallohydrolase [Caldilinea sp.]